MKSDFVNIAQSIKAITLNIIFELNIKYSVQNKTQVIYREVANLAT